MEWPTWQEAALATAIAVAVFAVTRQKSHRHAKSVAALARELALICGLYAVWRLARQLPLTHEEGAVGRALWIWDVQRWLPLPSELALEQWVMNHDWLARLTVAYYATMHVPGLLAFLVWLWVFHRDQFPRWRNALAITTGFCLFIRFIRVAPPRLLPELGFVDLPAEIGWDIYGPPGTGVSDQYAAMPSIHVAWAAIAGLGVWSVASGWWRWLGLFHLAATFWAVTATANHWWLDGWVAVGLVWLGLVLDRTVRSLFRRRRAPPAQAREVPEPASA